MSNQWIEHDNGQCPVEGTKLVEITHDDPDHGEISVLGPLPAGLFAWEAPDAAPRTMFYREVEQ